MLVNDTDADLNTLTAVLDAGPANAPSFTLNANGSFDYTPSLNFNGTDTFTYHANDGTANSNTATVTITVNPVNDQPTANAQSVTVAEDTDDNPITLTGSSGPPNESGQSLTFQLMSLPANGTLSETAGGPAVSGSFPIVLADGQIFFTPNAGYCTTDNDFEFRVQDSGGTTAGGVDTSANATVDVTVTCVNDDPVAVNDTATVDEDSSGNAIDVLDNDTDADGDTLSVSSVTDPANGSTTNNGTDVSYTPDPDFCGTDSFVYTVSDGEGGSDTGIVTVTVDCVNDEPVAEDDMATVDEDSSGNVIDVLGNDTDADSDTLSVSSVTDPANGSTTNNGTDVSYTPDADFCGTDSFEYTVSDGEGGSDTAEVAVTVECVNDAPVAEDDSYDATEDTLLTVAAPGVLGNDTDAEDDPLTSVLVVDVSQGTLALSADGSFTYEPDANFCGGRLLHLQGERRHGRQQRRHGLDRRRVRERRACGERRLVRQRSRTRSSPSSRRACSATTPTPRATT